MHFRRFIAAFSAGLAVIIAPKVTGGMTVELSERTLSGFEWLLRKADLCRWARNLPVRPGRAKVNPVLSRTATPTLRTTRAHAGRFASAKQFLDVSLCSDRVKGEAREDQFPLV
jgi:hypothetical protein